MPLFDVEIFETAVSWVASPGVAGPVPELRRLLWRGEASDPAAAENQGYLAWDEKYGAGQRPTTPCVKVTPA